MFLQTRERAQGLVEYGLIIALVAVLAIAGLIIFGPAVSSLLSRLGGSVYASPPRPSKPDTKSAAPLTGGVLYFKSRLVRELGGGRGSGQIARPTPPGQAGRHPAAG